MLQKFRDSFSSLSHFAGALLAIVGAIFLLYRSEYPFPDNLPLIVYGISLFLLFLASAVYHAAQTTPKVLGVLRKMDHAAIYLLIAGSYTPFCVIGFSGFWKWGFLAIIWSLAVIGIILKIWFIHTPRWVTAGVYVLMGWLSIFAFREIFTSLPDAAAFWLITGGLIYTAGAVIYVTKRMNFLPGVFGFHEVWHLFVLLGAGAHFIAIYSLVQQIPLA